MNQEILIEQIKQFSDNYHADPNNKIIEDTITKNGLENSCIDRNVLIQNQPIFNIELPDTKRYDQKNSWRCWIFAGLNLIEHNMAENLDVDVMNLQLSDSYIAFFDRLEKSNNLYEEIIQLENTDIEYIHEEKIIQEAVSEGGYFELFRAIISKYGIVPASYMPSSVEGQNVEKVEALYTEKVKKDVIELLALKKSNTSLEMLRRKKEVFIQENYALLSKVYGEPLQVFDYEYKDRNGTYRQYKNMTPLQFKNQFLTLNLEDFIVLGNTPMHNREYNRVYRKKYWNSVRPDTHVQYLNLPIEDLKTLCICQLKDKIPVYMGGHIRKFRDKESGILDTRLYNYEQTLKFKRLSKQEALDFYDITCHHIMVFTGVHLIDDKPQRWKIEDSYGDSQKYDGYYIMNDNFFEEFVLKVVIHKKYLSEEQLKLLEQEPILYKKQEVL